MLRGRLLRSFYHESKLGVFLVVWLLCGHTLNINVLNVGWPSTSVQVIGGAYRRVFGVELQHFFTVVVENDGGGVAVVDPLKQAVTEGLWVER